MGSTEVEHDADGNLIKKTLADGAVWQYRWDAHGRLSSVSRPDGKEVTFSYDAFGRRLSKTFDGRTTEYIWDGNDLVHERVREGDAPSVLTTWVFEPGTFAPLAKIEGRKRFGVVSDHLGTPTVLTTEAGALAWKAQLDIYGVPREEAAGVAEADRTENPWRFPGQYEDAETGLYYNRFRYYDPGLGRYLSEDPIGLAGGAALLGYVEDSLAQRDFVGLSGSCMKPGDVHPSTPVGRVARGPMTVHTPGTNLPGTISGRPYSGHALDRMQQRGLVPSVIEDTIAHGAPKPGRVPGTTAHHSAANNVTVITDTDSGRVVTDYPGKGTGA